MLHTLNNCSHVSINQHVKFSLQTLVLRDACIELFWVELCKCFLWRCKIIILLICFYLFVIYNLYICSCLFGYDAKLDYPSLPINLNKPGSPRSESRSLTTYACIFNFLSYINVITFSDMFIRWYMIGACRFIQLSGAHLSVLHNLIPWLLKKIVIGAWKSSVQLVYNRW